MNHPGWDGFCHDYFYSAAVFAGLLVAAAWSGTSRRLVKKKVLKILAIER